MDSLSLELNGCEIAAITQENGTVRIQIARADLIKTLTGSADRTRWWQAGELILEGATLETALPNGALRCIGGDLDENIYTYRNMIPIPFASRGHLRCTLHFENSTKPFIATATAAQLKMHETPKYIEHLRAADVD